MSLNAKIGADAAIAPSTELGYYEKLGNRVLRKFFGENREKILK